MELDTPIWKIPYISPSYVKKLRKLKIKTAGDLLNHYPTRYQDFTLISKIAQLQPGETVTLQGKVERMENKYTKRGKKIQKAIVAEETGKIEVVWYNQPFLVKTITPGSYISLSGKVKIFDSKLVLEPVEYELLKATTPNSELRTVHTGRLVPIYPETHGLSSKWLRARIAFLLPKLLPQVKEYLPKEIIKYNHLLDIKSALLKIHFPQNKQEAKRARERLSFEELFFVQLRSALRKAQWQKETVSNKYQITDNRKQITDFYKKLPFKLTRAQRRCIGEILTDLGTEKPMNRLLQGDVGSGKTVVAAVAMYLTYLNNLQSALMAPTEILAFQHYQTIKNMLTPFGLKIALMTKSKKNLPNYELPVTNYDIIIGTHALLNEKIKFSNLGLVVIDEQHRFGVAQRAKLRKKGINPHLLTMTATPIPRSVALTLYGELDLSYIDEMPPGRKKVKTWLIPPPKREAAYEWLKKQIQADAAKQAFIICPLIEESEHETMQSVKAATAEYQRLQKEVFPELKLGLLHGKLKTKEKDKVLSDFRKGKLNILVATAVVEVGLDIPSATIMIIEGAQRFGLAQLHQLRGRVGRGKKQSYCLLFSETQSEKTLKRLKALEKIHNGAQLAEVDLKLRGPGEIYGTRQHGFLNLKIAKVTDYNLIEKTQKAVRALLKKDPDLSQFPLLKEKVERDKIREISPD